MAATTEERMSNREYVLEGLAPAVAEGHLAQRSARRAPELPERIAQRDQRGRLDVRRDAEQLLHLRVAEPVNGREAAPDAERAGGPHDVLDGRIDRRAGRQRRLGAGIERDAGEDEHRRLAEMLAKVPG